MWLSGDDAKIQIIWEPTKKIAEKLEGTKKKIIFASELVYHEFHHDMNRTLHTLVTCTAAVALAVVTACGGKGSQPQSDIPDKTTNANADSLVHAAEIAGDYERALILIDSLADAGELSPVRADDYRGNVYYNMSQRQKSIDCYRRATADDNPPAQDFWQYINAGTNLATGLLVQRDFDGTISTALHFIERLRQVDSPRRAWALKNLYISLGATQLMLGRHDEAAKSYDEAYHWLRLNMENDSTGRDLPSAIITLGDIAVTYFNAHLTDEAEKWVNRKDSLLAIYEECPEADASRIEKERALLALDRTQIFQARGQKDEAARHYADYTATGYGRSVVGRIDGCDYLMAAHRYAEAADIYARLDRFMQVQGMGFGLEEISGYLLPKLRANYYAGRKDSALRTAMRLAEIYDSALVRQKNSDAAELATVYDTQGKERRIAEQQAELSQQRWIGTMVALVLITIFFLIYTWHRRRATKRLATAHATLEQTHAELQTAYGQLEETTAAKERIESELRIARNIQMSMVPSIFPKREGLDLYASMTPAKEVGGDLYGYLLESDQLYFALGDVSGKGVPASLFMAQATRLFMTLARQGMKPAEICTHMNDALSGDDNESSMFVTLFLGLVDLQTGHLDFCNTGHNPPVIGIGEHSGEFLNMLPNLPIGLFPDYNYQGEEIDTIMGRPLFIYTDGLNEAENREHAQFGENRLLDILRNMHFDTARQVIETLSNEVERHRNGAEPNDDLTMMCLKVCPCMGIPVTQIHA